MIWFTDDADAKMLVQIPESITTELQEDRPRLVGPKRVGGKGDLDYSSHTEKMDKENSEYLMWK